MSKLTFWNCVKERINKQNQPPRFVKERSVHCKYCYQVQSWESHETARKSKQDEFLNVVYVFFFNVGSISYFFWHLLKPWFAEKETCKGHRECLNNVACCWRPKSCWQTKGLGSSVTLALLECLFSVLLKKTLLHLIQDFSFVKHKSSSHWQYTLLRFCHMILGDLFTSADEPLRKK